LKFDQIPEIPAPSTLKPEALKNLEKGGSLSDDAPAGRDAAEAEMFDNTDGSEMAVIATPSKPAKPVTTPEQEYMATAVTQPVDPVEHILLKPTPVLTEKEVEAMIGHDAYWLTGNRHPLGDPLQKKTKEFFYSLYPEPQSERAFTPREEPRPLSIGYDFPLSRGRETVAEELSEKAANSNIPDAVCGLQNTLNKRGYSNDNQVLPHFKEDGNFGPRTLARLDEELLRDGSRFVVRDLNGLSVA